AGEDLVPEPAHEVAQLQGARAALQRRLQGADAADQEQPQPGPQRRVVAVPAPVLDDGERSVVAKPYVAAPGAHGSRQPCRTPPQGVQGRGRPPVGGRFRRRRRDQGALRTGQPVLRRGCTLRGSGDGDRLALPSFVKLSRLAVVYGVCRS
ncbi:unnamed protein product, partial [Ixodes pacificus]